MIATNSNISNLPPLIKFLPYQRAWLNDDSRFKIGMFARQTGKSFTNAAEILWDCIKAELAGTTTRWVILSRGERQATELMDAYLKPLARAYMALLQGKIDGDKMRLSKHEICLPAGSRITALPANQDAARGFSANLYLDEFAFHRHDDKIWQALYPIISAPQFKIRITSTPAGKNNKFYQLMNPEQGALDADNWSRHQVDIYQAVQQGLPRNIAELKKAAGDPLLWQQEYELNFMDDQHAWLDYALIMACEDDTTAQQELRHDSCCFVGIDIAQKHDLYVLIVMELIGDILWCRHIDTAKNISFAEQEVLLDHVMRTYRPLKIVMDATGMGAMPFERAKQLYGPIIEGIHFTAQKKLYLATELKAHFQNRTLRIPASADLRRDLHQPEISYSPAGLMMLKAARSNNGHADRFWAMAMAVHASQTAPADFAYQGYRH